MTKVRFFTLLLVISMIVCSVACGVTPPDEQIEETTVLCGGPPPDMEDFKVELGTSLPGAEGNYANDDRPSEQTSINFICYKNDFVQFCFKTVENSPAAYYLIDQLTTLKETGEVTRAWSDKPFDTAYYDYEPYVRSGTMWLEIGDEIYRLESDSRLCRVDTHYGAGTVLDANAELIRAIKGAYHYYPRDYYSGYFTRYNGTLNLDHVYAGDSAVSISIKSMTLPRTEGENSTVVLELLSDEDKTVYVSVATYQGDDIVGDGKTVEVFLERGVAKTVEVSIYAWPCSMYTLEIGADNTVVDITVDSRYASVKAFDRTDVEGIADHLDAEGFISYKEFYDLIDTFSYKGTKLSEQVHGGSYDLVDNLGGGSDFMGDYFEYGLSDIIDEARIYLTLTSYFKTKVNIDGLTMPRGTKFGDTLKQVIHKLGGTGGFSVFVADAGDYSTMTLYIDELTTVILRKTSGDYSYVLEYRENCDYVNDNGNRVDATRYLTFEFDGDEKLEWVGVRLIEQITLG